MFDNKKIFLTVIRTYKVGKILFYWTEVILGLRTSVIGFFTLSSKLLATPVPTQGLFLILNPSLMKNNIQVPIMYNPHVHMHTSPCANHHKHT
jgi:hypothetical protein